MHPIVPPPRTPNAPSGALGNRPSQRTAPAQPARSASGDAEAHDFPSDCGAQDAGSDFGSACTCLACSRYLKYVEVHA